MGKLTTAERKKIPTHDFGLPQKRGKIDKFGKPGNKVGAGAYPMEDKGHAIAAKAYATIEERAGKLSAANKAKIDAKADKVIKKEGGHPSITSHTDGKDTGWTDAKERAFKSERAKRKK